jgi:two-component system chemotaxis response regulator CheY
MAWILIVDDEDVLLEMIASLLEELGYQSIRATNGRQALERLAAEPELPALIITDLMMPRMGGAELVRALKADSRFHTVPVVLMSAASGLRGSHAVDGFLSKPFDLETLAEVIAQHVKLAH